MACHNSDISGRVREPTGSRRAGSASASGFAVWECATALFRERQSVARSWEGHEARAAPINPKPE
jgi:hypothetical protein